MGGWTLGTTSPGYDHLGARAMGGTRPELGLASGALAIVSGLLKKGLDDAPSADAVAERAR